MAKSGLGSYGIVANPAMPDQEPDDSAPLDTIAPSPPQPGQLQPLRAAPAPLAPLPVFRPNPMRQQQEQRLQQSLMQMENKPKPQGFWPKAESILKNIGSVAGNVILGSGTTSLIPGTAQHEAAQHTATQSELTGLQKEDQAEQQAFEREQAGQAENKLKGAQTEEAGAKAQSLENPEPNLQHIETDQGIFALNPKTKELTPLTFNGQPLKKPETAKTPNAKADLQQKLVDAQNSGDTAAAKKLQQQLKDIDPMGEERIVLQQQSQATSAQKARDQKTESEYTYTRNKWDKDLATYNAQNEKLQEAAGLIGKGALGDALGSIKSLSGLASGAGSGVRITQAELNSIARARGLGGDFQAALQKFGDGKNLTPQQEKQLKGILADVQRVASAKEVVINKGLDDLAEANDTGTVRKIDSQLRHVLMGGQ